jgi:hypothetical protein
MNTKILLLMVMPAMIISAAISAQETEWKDMFNGKNLKNWKKLNGTAGFVVEDGCITGISSMNTSNTFLTTGEEFTNFVLEFEMKMENGLNSGVQIRSHSLPAYENGRVHGLQVECDDSERAWSGGIYDESRKGWRYPLEYNPAAKKAYKNNQWNKYRVLAFDNHIITWINGIPCANLIEENVESGFIALQVHSISGKEFEGKKVQWKNIRIRDINSSDLEELKKINTPEVSYLKNKLTEREIQQGWKLLWDGKTTKGWKGANLKEFPKKGWLISDGELSVEKSAGAESANGGDIVTTRMYGNFMLEADFKLTKGANSGIKYFVNTELNKGVGSAIGCEFQLLDDINHPDAKKEGINNNRTLGSLYDLIAADGKYYNPYLPVNKYVNDIGKWNRARIIVNGNKIEHYLNGCKIVEYERGTQMWRALVAYSKYKNWPDFGEYKEGYILLQDHGDKVSFCNIKILELPQH